MPPHGQRHQYCLMGFTPHSFSPLYSRSEKSLECISYFRPECKQGSLDTMNWSVKADRQTPPSRNWKLPTLSSLTNFKEWEISWNLFVSGVTCKHIPSSRPGRAAAAHCLWSGCWGSPASGPVNSIGAGAEQWCHSPVEGNTHLSLVAAPLFAYSRPRDKPAQQACYHLTSDCSASQRDPPHIKHITSSYSLEGYSHGVTSVH